MEKTTIIFTFPQHIYPFIRPRPVPLIVKTTFTFKLQATLRSFNLYQPSHLISTSSPTLITPNQSLAMFKLSIALTLFASLAAVNAQATLPDVADVSRDVHYDLEKKFTFSSCVILLLLTAPCGLCYQLRRFDPNRHPLFRESPPYRIPSINQTQSDSL